jgi:hypothetical protein
MPRDGRLWSDEELAILDDWLITYEPPTNPFDAVFAIFNQPRGPDSPGCNGCHIREDEGPAPWWGATEDEVLDSLQRAGLVVGGRQSILAGRLHRGEMPMGGRLWSDEELAVLDNWIIAYE